MRWTVALSYRLPTRLSRCRSRLLDHTGRGAVPLWRGVGVARAEAAHVGGLAGNLGGGKGAVYSGISRMRFEASVSLPCATASSAFRPTLNCRSETFGLTGPSIAPARRNLFVV